MGRLVARELRDLVRCWPLWVLVPVAAVVGRALLPVNADAYHTYVYFDPQGADQVLESYRFDMRAVYTSGLAWAQLMAMAVGAYLALRHRPLGRGGGAQRRDPGPLIVAKAAAAACAGLVLAVADLALVLPEAQAHLAGHRVLPQLAQYGVAVPQPGLTTGSVWLVIVSAMVTVAMFGAVGVGVAEAGRWWLAGLVTGLLAVASLLFMAQDEEWDPPVALILVVTVLAAPFGLLWYALLNGLAPAGAAVTVGAAVLWILLGYDAARRRLERADRALVSGSGSGPE